MREFPGPEELSGIFGEAGFREVERKLLWGGIAALHWGVA